MKECQADPGTDESKVCFLGYNPNYHTQPILHVNETLYKRN